MRAGELRERVSLESNIDGGGWWEVWRGRAQMTRTGGAFEGAGRRYQVKLRSDSVTRTIVPADDLQAKWRLVWGETGVDPGRELYIYDVTPDERSREVMLECREVLDDTLQ